MSKKGVTITIRNHKGEIKDVSYKQLDLEYFIKGLQAFEEPDKENKNLDAIISELKSDGQLKLTYDEEMRQGKLYKVEAAIFKNIDQSLKKYSTKTYDIKVTPVMKIELTGQNFEIVSLSKNEEQPISTDEPSKWKWNVRPLKYGIHTLEVIASICIPVEGFGNKYRNFEELKAEINVLVNLPLAAKDKIVENWKWAVALVGLITLILSILNYAGVFGVRK